MQYILLAYYLHKAKRLAAKFTSWQPRTLSERDQVDRLTRKIVYLQEKLEVVASYDETLKHFLPGILMEEDWRRKVERRVFKLDFHL